MTIIKFDFDVIYFFAAVDIFIIFKLLYSINMMKNIKLLLSFIILNIEENLKKEPLELSGKMLLYLGLL